MRYSPILAPLKETGFKGRGKKKLHNISTFRFLYWYLVLDVGFGLPESVVLVNNSTNRNHVVVCLRRFNRIPRNIRTTVMFL